MHHVHDRRDAEERDIAGAALARLEVLAIVNAVLDRYPVIELSDEQAERQTASLLTHGFVHLPLQLRR